MNKVAQYLQEHLNGEVAGGLDVRQFYSRDASILSIIPSVVAFPRDENDVRKAARFSWQLAERDQLLPITARGGGTDTSGAAIGSGILLVFTKHMNRIVELSPKTRTVAVEPGVTYQQLEDILQTHGFSLPPQPGTSAVATIGGGIANNSIGSRSLKYGSTGDYVENLRVVLANGEVIETGPLSKRELNRKLGLSTFEGEVYRQLDTLLEENSELISQGLPGVKTNYNATGYDIFSVRKGSSFDLTPLFIGSQGSLGIISEASLRLEPLKPYRAISMLIFEQLEQFEEVLPRLLKLNPSYFMAMNRTALVQASRSNPAMYNGVSSQPAAAVHAFIEFDSPKENDRKRLMKSLRKIVEKIGGEFMPVIEPADQEKYDKLLHSSSTVLRASNQDASPVPVGEDVAVPPDRLVDLMRKIEALYGSVELEPAMWVDASGIVRMRPFLHLGEIGDRQKLFKLTDGLYTDVLEMGGSTTAAAGDGRVRAHYNQKLYGEKLNQVMLAVKKIFDPKGLLNPGVKTASLDEMKALIADNYSLRYHDHHLYL